MITFFRTVRQLAVIKGMAALSILFIGHHFIAPAQAFPVPSKPARSNELPREIQVAIDQPAYSKLPVFATVTFKNIYPGLCISQFPLSGPFSFEVKYGTKQLRQVYNPDQIDGIGGGTGSTTSSPFRVPLHLMYNLDSPGVYSVRASAQEQDGDKRKSFSNWTTFRVAPSTAKQRDQWLNDLIEMSWSKREQRFEGRFKSGNPQQLEVVFDYLPALAVAVPDARVLRAMLAETYSTDSFHSECAQAFIGSYTAGTPGVKTSASRNKTISKTQPGNIRSFSAANLGAQVFDLIEKKGFNNALAMLALGYCKDRDPLLLSYALRDLRTGADQQVIAALSYLTARISPGCRKNWGIERADSDTIQRVEKAVLAEFPRLIKRKGVRQALSLYFGDRVDSQSKAALYELVKYPICEEQALIALSWHKDKRDLPVIADLLTTGTPNDQDYTNYVLIAHAVKQLVTDFGDDAVPFLQRAQNDSKSALARFEIARELSKRGDHGAYNTLLQLLGNGDKYSGWVIDWCANQSKVPQALVRSKKYGKTQAEQYLQALLAK